MSISRCIIKNNVTNKYKNRLKEINESVKELTDKNIDNIERYGSDDSSITESINSLLNEKNDIMNKINVFNEKLNNVDDDESNEKMSKAEKKKALSDLEFSYDKKFNAFCLSISGYDENKLSNMMEKKKIELKNAKDKKSKANGHFEKAKSDLEIRYITNVCNKCGDMIRKKQKMKKYM